MNWDILYASQVSKPNTFQELATQAHDVELTIACYRRRLKEDESISLRNKSSLVGSEKKECPYSESNAP